MKIVCSTCCVTMKCSRTGVFVRYNGKNTYSGDEYKCPQCGNKTIITANEGFDYSKDINGIGIDIN